MMVTLISMGCFVILAVAGINFRRALTMDNDFPGSEDLPLVSILVPARNEESSIAACLDFLVNQTYPNFEIFVYDDFSEDRTAEIINNYVSKYPQVHYCQGVAPPAGWTGKNWACDQLSRYANGEYLAFVDADVECHPKALRNAIKMIQHFHCHFLSCFPTQKMQTLGEKCLVPLMHWFLLAFLPLYLVFQSRRVVWVAANGQFLILEKKVYEIIGGHRLVHDQIVEDMELARRVKRHGYRCLTVLGGQTIFCRMYENFSSAFRGFSKNFFAGFNTTIPRFSLFLLGITFLFCYPLIAVWFDLRYSVAIFFILGARFLVSLKSDQNILWNFILHPFQMFCMTAIGIYAVCRARQGSIIWKGREVIVTRAKKQRTLFLIGVLFYSLFTSSMVSAEDKPLSVQEREVRSYLRNNLQKALEDESAVDTLLAHLQNKIPINPEVFPATLMAYYGTLQGLKAKFSVLPTKKLHHLKACLKYLDQSVKKDDADLETFFLRFSSLHHLPPFFGIPQKRYEDIKQICRLLRQKDYMFVDRHFQLLVVDFMLQSRRLNTQQRDELQVLKLEMNKAQ